MSWRYCVWEPLEDTYHWVEGWYALKDLSVNTNGLPVFKVFVDEVGFIVDEQKVHRKWVWITQ